MGLDRAAERQVGQAAKVVAEIAQGEDPVYGINTGFGDLSTVRVPHDDLRALQRNLVRSHAVGVGPPLPEDVVRAILVLRANTLAAAMQQEVDTLEEVVEPYLLYEQFIRRTPNGRVATAKAYAHLKLRPPGRKSAQQQLPLENGEA